VIILNSNSEIYYGLDNVGALIWKELLRGRAPKEIVERICKEYSVKRPKDVEKDLKHLLKELLSEGLLEAVK
jgi:hypothetical protein